MSKNTYEGRVKSRLSNLSGGYYSNPMINEFVRTREMLAYQTCLMEDILAELVKARTHEISNEHPYKGEVINNYAEDKVRNSLTGEKVRDDIHICMDGSCPNREMSSLSKKMGVNHDEE